MLFRSARAVGQEDLAGDDHDGDPAALDRGAHRDLEPVVYEFFRPVGTAARELTHTVMEFTRKVSGGIVGSLGLVLLLWTLLGTLEKIESSFNYLWHVEESRSLARRISEYLAVTVLAPMLLVLGIALAHSFGLSLAPYAIVAAVGVILAALYLLWAFQRAFTGVPEGGWPGLAVDAPRLWDAVLARGVMPCGLGARDTLRLEAGMNLYGQDMDPAVTPYECGLDWTVSLQSPRDFVGRAALEKRQPAWRLLGLVLQERGGVLRSHQPVRNARGAGMLTSGSFSPTMNASIALARLPAGSAPGETAEVEIRGRWLAARTVQPPFVRHGKILA